MATGDVRNGYRYRTPEGEAKATFFVEVAHMENGADIEPYRGIFYGGYARSSEGIATIIDPYSGQKI